MGPEEGEQEKKKGFFSVVANRLRGIFSRAPSLSQRDLPVRLDDKRFNDDEPPRNGRIVFEEETQPNEKQKGGIFSGFLRGWNKLADWFRQTWVGQTFLT